VALPVDSRTANNLFTTTLDEMFEDIQDGFFLDSPFTTRLLERDNVKMDGGAFVRQPFIYAGVGGGSHATGTQYDTSLKQVLSYMLFPWTELYAPLTFDELEQAKNEGAAAIIDYAETIGNVAELTLKETFATQVFNASPNLPVDLQSILTALVAYNSSSTYGGLTADTSAQGIVLAPNVTNRINTTGGPFSWDMLQNTFGACTYGRIMPDLIVTTQPIYNKMVLRSIPAQRFRNDDMKRNFGAEGISYNGADIMVDQECPSGYIFVLNTRFIKLILNTGRSFVRRSRMYGLSGRGFPIVNDSMSTDQIVCMTQLVFNATRYSGYISSVS
jgi:hypothetical protein